MTHTASPLHTLLLKRAVAARFGNPLSTTNDYDRLRDDIIALTGQPISLSTLKRLWGYVEGWQEPRRSTLDVLSLYAGYPSFEAFAEHCDKSAAVESGFSSAVALPSADIPTDTLIEVRWLPDRVVQLRHEGGGLFTVIANNASKLREGWQLSTSCFVNGEPLYATISAPGLPQPRPYLAGKQNGITFTLLKA